MADRIKLLPDSVANQIAAGEVVNRPASVVKELMENAVDAGARAVTVNFRDGGRELIQIKDDGCGMSPQDARMAFERHATSKISSVDDIYALTSFGFRGEALASIAAVAQVELHSRQEDSELGTRLNIDGGAFTGQSAVAAPRGTQIWIRNLFYNVPARKKFLDRGSTESTHIVTEFQRVALAHPEVAFQLFRDDAPVYNLPAGELHARIVGIMGKGAAPKLLEVGVSTSLARVRGFIGRPAAARQRCREQFLFVGGRFFKSAFFHKAIVKAYDKLIPATVQPPYFLYLDIDPEEIDVNVHPQKTEVKFTNQSAVWQIINAAVRETLAKSGAVPMMDFDSDDRLEIPVLGGHAGLGPRGDYTPSVHEPAVVRERGYNPFVQYMDDATPQESLHDSLQNLPQATFGTLETIFESTPEAAFGAVLETAHEATSGPPPQPFDGEQKVFSAATNIGEGYAAALYGGIFVAVDLRRAREAVLYDRFVTMLRSGHSATQQLLFPERMTLSADDMLLHRDHTAEFAALGFDTREAGDHAIEIFGVPADMPSESLDEVVYGMLDELRDGLFAGGEARRRRLAAVMARSGAGTSTAAARLSTGETENLLTALAATANPSYTPQGKPVFAEITIEEIRNKLK
ncbi:MAG: DNA mismatch repair endonuclease MutL [Alistipes sp.]|jgi:DNA mismatch repair protein MutL|nr:DNA mismatch repair endonuclease MutL [Alistipes sp.]